MNLLTLENCSKYQQNQPILKGISFNIKSGVTIGLIGKSGSGKSTLLLLMSQLSNYDTGTIKINSKNIGIVFQDYALWPHMTVLKNIILAPVQALAIHKKEAIVKAMALLNHFGLADKADCYPNQLSGGQKQKVAIIRCLITEPDLILFDEPTAALDPESIKDLVVMINELKDLNVTSVIASHDLSFIEHVAEEIIYLDKGEIIETGHVNILQEPKTQQLKTFVHSIIK